LLGPLEVLAALAGAAGLEEEGFALETGFVLAYVGAGTGLAVDFAADFAAGFETSSWFTCVTSSAGF
jgi:hypothetical protein